MLDEHQKVDYVSCTVVGMAEDDQDRWQRFVAEQLAEINEKNSSLLGGHDPKQIPNDEPETDYNQYHSTTPQQVFQYLLSNCLLI